MIVLLLFPVVIASIYEYARINDNEELISTVYKKQLETIVSSVNSYAQDIGDNWASRIELWLQYPSDKGKLEKLTGENNSIKGIFSLNEKAEYRTLFAENNNAETIRAINGNFDGQGCYRTKFKLNNNLIGQKLYLACGKIDDEDQIILNGHLIGVTEDMHKTRLGDSFIGDWQIRRAYKIPEGLLNESGINTLVVLVDDHGGMGGIYEGPIGLMTRDQYSRYEERHEVQEWFPGHHFIKSLLFD